MSSKLIKSKIIFIIFLIILIALGCVIYQKITKKEIVDEGISSLLYSDNDAYSNHKVDVYSLGNTAQKLQSEISNDIAIMHKFIDGIPVYEIYKDKSNCSNILFFFHGKESKKEEYLSEMVNYAYDGYFCCTVDLVGYGERTTDKEIMSFEITKLTGKDLDNLLDYYFADGQSKKFAIIGFSQGGSIAYWYTAYGKYKPSAIVVGNTSPDFTCSADVDCIKGGHVIGAIRDEKYIQKFISSNNPILYKLKFKDIPILSANNTEDTIISYIGSENFEKDLVNMGNNKVNFYYYPTVEHDVPEDFIQKIPEFIEKYLPNETSYEKSIEKH